ncbi:unnamed protein product, partial [Ranitomeya imitator]
EIKCRAAAFRQDSNYSTEAGGCQENLKKNRYKDILPYDQTRVPVTLLAEDAGSDYINASFIQGVDKQPRYIATQGPLSHTVVDFWRMIWQYNVKKKCERYWPLDQETVQYGAFTVTTVAKDIVNAEVVFRNLKVMFQEEVRELVHFQYIAWPDRGIPDSYSCFLEMIYMVRQHQDEHQAPMCVHCSAGCGRTGVICTVEYIQCLLHKQRVPSNFSIFEVVMEMRRQRPSAVQTRGKHRVTKRGPALSNPMFTLVTSEDIAESASHTPIQRCLRVIQRQNKVLDFLLRPTTSQQDPDRCCVSNTNDIAIQDVATSRIASDIVVKLVSVKEQYDFLYHAITEMFEKQLKGNYYENLKENKAPLYDDAVTLTLPNRSQTPNRRRDLHLRYILTFLSPRIQAKRSEECIAVSRDDDVAVSRDRYVIILRDHSVDRLTERRERERPVVDPRGRRTSDMSNTYAVVNKKSTAPVLLPGSNTQETRSPTSSHVQYDNVRPRSSPATPVDQLYSSVVPKPNRMSACVTTPSNPGIISSSYSLAGNPTPSEPASVEYSQVNIPSAVPSFNHLKGDHKRFQTNVSIHPTNIHMQMTTHHVFSSQCDNIPVLF